MDIEEKVKRLIRPSILATASYHVPESEGLIKLDAMENPYPWPDEIKKGWLEVLADAELNRYPDAEAQELKDRLKKVFLIPPASGLLLGNGSDEIIQIIAMAVSKPGAVILAPEPGFVMYRMIADMTSTKYIGVPLKTNDFSLDLESMLQAIEQHKPGIIFLAWPNNPTGNLFDEKDVITIIRNAPGIVVVDEAYQVFTERSFMGQLDNYDNLLVMRTLSKMGLAGLRLGFLTGHALWLKEFEKLRMPYNISVLTQHSISFILEHIDVLISQAQCICRDREILYQELINLPGIKAWPSSANFILVKTENTPAAGIYEQLKNRGVLIKNLDGSHPMLENCLRVTIGTKEENQAFLSGLKDLLASE